ncbi:unnamed protein product [Mytilus edulis]|uniref:Uncharacterized protein n=1 Tax=Mytilus edulis TaxID=6550 RepID=A0A8S3TVI7_MYTED|nr:unnamed protein product [Mytilus edulis]
MTTDLSISFYHYLCQKIGTPDIVKIRRLSYAICDYVSRFSGRDSLALFWRFVTRISSGSKAEGLDMKKSDLDMMHVLELLNIVEVPLDSCGLFSFLITTEYTKPGFVRLKRLNAGLPMLPLDKDWCKERDGHIFLSNFFATDLKSWNLLTGFDFNLITTPLSILEEWWYYDVPTNILVVLFRRHKMVSHRYLYTLFWCAICQHIGYKNIGIQEQSNKGQYKRYKTYLPWLVMGLQKDAITGWLCLASYHFSIDSYKTCLNLIDHILQKYGFRAPSDIETHIGHINSLELEAVKYGIMNPHDICRRHFVDVHGFNDSIKARPLKLKLDILDNLSIVTSPLIYTHFLRFMCCFHLHDSCGVKFALREIHRLRTGREISVHYCLGLAYYTLKEYSTALSFLIPFSEYLKSNPKHDCISLNSKSYQLNCQSVRIKDIKYSNKKIGECQLIYQYRFTAIFVKKLGTEEIVKVRRLSHAIWDYISPFTSRELMELFRRTMTRISSGSKAEGLDMKRSDLDTMFVMEFLNVVEDPLDRFGFFSFLISTGYTKPGFVRLKLLNSAIPVEHICCKENDGYVFLSSELVKKIAFSIVENNADVIIHGPCITTANEKTVSDFFATDLQSLKISEGFDYELINTPFRILDNILYPDVSLNTLFVLFSRHKLESHRYLYTLYWCAICQGIGHKNISIQERANKDQYKRYKTYLPYLIMGLQKDAISGWLSLASHLFTVDNYNTCLKLIDYILCKYCFEKSSYNGSYIGHTNNLELETVKYGGMNAHSFCRQHFVDLYGFIKIFGIRPLKLKLEILDSVYITSPIVYTYFLRFMCCFHLCDNSGVRSALRDLQRVQNHYTEVDYCL